MSETTPTRKPGDSTNAIASTAFVTAAIATAIAGVVPGPTVLTTVAVMTAQAPAYWTNIPLIYVKGYRSTNDGGEGYFIWDSSSSLTPDNGVIFQPDSAPATGRLIRVMTNGIPSAAQFGCDSTGTLDSLAYFNNWKASTWTDLFVPTGTYKTSSPWLIPNTRNVVGAGSKICTLSRFGSSTPVYLLGNVPPTTTAAYTVSCSGIRLLGDSTLSYGMEANGVTRSQFSDIRIESFTGASAIGLKVYGTPLGGTSHTLCNRNNFSNVFIDTTTNSFWMGKDAADSSGVGSTCNNENYFYNLQCYNFTAVGAFIGSSQGSIFYNLVTITNGDNITNIKCTGQLTGFINPVADNSIPGGLPSGAVNAYGYPYGRGGPNNTVGFYFYADAVQGSPTGSYIINQVGDGCYNRITFDSAATAQTVSVIAPNSPVGFWYTTNTRQGNQGWFESDATHRAKWSMAGTSYTFDFDSDVTNPSGTLTQVVKFQGTEIARWSYTIGGNAFLLLGKTTSAATTQGIAINGADGTISLTPNGTTPVSINSLASGNQTIQLFQLSAVTKGSISYASGPDQVNYNQTSDYRIKTNVVPLRAQDARRRIMQLNPISYSPVGKSTRVIGFLAHEFAKSYPHAVTGKKDAIDKNGVPILQQMDKTAVIADLVTLVQELQSRIETLEKANV